MKNNKRLLNSKTLILFLLIFFGTVFLLSSQNFNKEKLASNRSLQSTQNNPTDGTSEPTQTLGNRKVALNTTSSNKDPFNKKEIIVKYKSKTLRQDRNYIEEGVAIRQVGLPRYFGDFKKFENQDSTDVQDKIVTLNANPNVVTAQPNYTYTMSSTTPNDTDFSKLWGLKNTGQSISGSYILNNPGTMDKDMNLVKAWDITTDCSNVIVAVLDTGVNYNHEDLINNMWEDSNGKNGYNFIENDDDPMDYHGHGTHVAGTIAAQGNNSIGSTGICWTAKIMAVKVLSDLGSGSTLNVANGIRWAVDNGAKVINMSLGAKISGTDYMYASAIKYARDNDVLTITAAGNDGFNNDESVTANFVPCDITWDNNICVAALDQNYALADFSNYGITSVDVGAPGTNIRSTWFGDSDNNHDNFSSNTGGLWDTFMIGPFNHLMQNPSTQAGYSPDNFNSTDYDQDYSDNITTEQMDLDYAIDPSADKIYFGLDFKVNFGSNSDIYHRYEDSLVISVSNPSSSKTNPLFFINSNFNSLEPVSLNVASICKGLFSCRLSLILDNSQDGVTGKGVDVLQPYFDSKTLKTNRYIIINGTSMAAPHVSGLATMLRSYNNGYSFSEAAESIKNSGDATNSLNGFTTTGKAVDVFKALTYIATPNVSNNTAVVSLNP